MKSSPWRREKALNYRGFPWRALLWSLLLHTLAFAALAPFVPERARVSLPAAPLRGELQPPREAASAPQSAAPAVAVRSSGPVARHETPTDPAIAVPPSPSVAGLPPAAQPRGDGAAMSSGASPPQPERAGAAGGEVAPLATPQPPTAASPRETDERGPNLAGLRQFRLALALEARRYRRYPDLARRAGLAGTVEVRVGIEAGGLRRRAELGRSSGNATLDAAAVEMMQQAVQRAPLPESLRGRDFTVLLPVVFELEE